MHLEMLRTHPITTPESSELGELLAALSECAQVCTLCADACLSEDMLADLRACIRLNQDCADVCAAAERVLARRVEPDRAVVDAVLAACIAACAACAAECEKHADMHEHCRICAEACRRCEELCSSYQGSAA